MNSLANARTLYRFCGFALLMKECRVILEKARIRKPYDVSHLLTYGFVYFVQGKKTGLVKIGYSVRYPSSRIDELRSASPDKLILLGTAPGSRTAEAHLHNMFADDHSHAEWFKPSDRLLSLAASLPPCQGQAILCENPWLTLSDINLMETWEPTREEKCQYVSERLTSAAEICRVLGDTKTLAEIELVQKSAKDFAGGGGVSETETSGVAT